MRMRISGCLAGVWVGVCLLAEGIALVCLVSVFYEFGADLFPLLQLYSLPRFVFESFSPT